MAEEAVVNGNETEINENLYGFYKDMQSMGMVISELCQEMYTLLNVVSLENSDLGESVPLPEELKSDITKLWASRLMSLIVEK